MLNQKIYSQGYLDSACFLYALMNAYKSLVSPQQNIRAFNNQYGHHKWKKLVAITPSVANFLNGFGSYVDINKPDVDLGIKDSLVDHACKIFSGSKKQFFAEKICMQDIGSVDFTSSVLIFCERRAAHTSFHQDLDHWLCAVNNHHGQLLLACSFTLYCHDHYQEFTEREFLRSYNNCIDISGITARTIYQKSVYKLSMSEA
ncbi:MAG: hypothetical protein HOM11_00390 [Methylococcales bacterium]|jgi:hypothetical protein|nr:hypothetical protein [Methylococcales bacterium]MBT7444510.1 hypothetical protein [Methylococcales bacterium]